jgi:hypothetical protein
MNTASQDPSSTVHPDPVENTSKVDPDSVKVSAKNDSSLHRASRDGRCQYRFSNGKRCRLPGSKSQFGLCSQHFGLNFPAASQHQSQTDSEDLSSELLGEASGFESAADVKEFLARLLVLVTKGRVIPRRVAVLTYITNQLLHSQSAFYREVRAQDDESQQIIFDLPRPHRDDPLPNEASGNLPRPGDSRRTTQGRIPMAWAAPDANRDPEKKNVMTNNSSGRLDGHSGVR